jgi:SRSO17 transposase
MDAQQIRNLTPRLMDYVSRFHDCFRRRENREHLVVYVQGQLSNLEQKSVEPIALKAGIPPRTLQEFLGAYRWNEDLVRRRLHEMVAGEHACPHSVGIIDETSDAKKGTKTPGVQRQHCGAVGKQDNCIVTVHLGYAADDFHCLIDGELFLPESWSNDRERCREAGIPDSMVYRPKSQIALELYDRAVEHGVRMEWLTFDEWYGAKPQFLRDLDARGQKFVGEVPRCFRAWAESPRVTDRPYRRGGRGQSRRTPRVTADSRPTMTVEDMMRFHAPLRDQAWTRYRIKDGEKGPMVWEVKNVRIVPKDEEGLPARPYWLIVARNVLQPDMLKYFVSNAPLGTKVATMLLVAFSRWRVERCFEDEKGELGLDHYEGRRYQGLKRHLILTAVSHLFLAKAHQELRGEKPGVGGVGGTDGLPGADGDGGGGAELVAFGASWSTLA